MKKVILITSLAFSMLVSNMAIAGPFGLDKGMKQAELPKDAELIQKGYYRLKQVPNPHPAFDYYVVQVAESAGLCWIKAIGKDIATSSHGTTLRSEFRDLRSRLDNVYGASNETNTLLPGSIWNEPQDYMMGLVKKERFLFAEWKNSAGSQLKDGIESIGLVANALGSGKGYLTLEYSFENYQACETEINSNVDSSL